MKRLFLLLAASAALSSCGGSDGGTSSSGPIGSTPTPTPTSAPAPTPTPTPTPTPISAAVSYIHVFAVQDGDGAQPNGPLVQASDGNFYGTTRAGGGNRCFEFDNFCGAIFRLTPGGQESVIHSFRDSKADGFSPSSPLIQGRDGALYGLTASGGAYGSGALYRVTLSGAFSLVYSFGATSGDGIVPIGPIVVGADGSFYGTTTSGGINHCIQIPQAGGNCGTVFRITPAGVGQTLYSFGSFKADGVQPNGLMLASDGNFYGTTSNGGANTCSSTEAPYTCGTIFRVTPAGQATIIRSFGDAPRDGLAPQGTMTQGRDGALYGTTVSGGGGTCGGYFGCGTVFRLTLTGDYSLIYRFAVNGRSDGDGPAPYIIQGADGYFYGTTNSGGAFAADRTGTAFRLSPTGEKTILYSFGPFNENPSAPVGGVIQANDGSFYGILAENGRYGGVGARSGFGAVFKMTLK